MNEEVILQDLDGIKGSLLCIVDRLLVVRFLPNEGTEPSRKIWEDLAVGEGEPSDDRSVILLCLAEESGLFVLRGDCLRIKNQ